MTVNGYKTSMEIAKENNVNEKTIRKRMKELQQEIDGNGAKLISKQRLGFKLCILDRDVYENWKQQAVKKARNAVPDSTETRVQYVLALLLNRKDYIKIETLGEFLCVSNKTISMIMKTVEFLLNEYEIKLIRKPYYGIKASGDEFCFRKCMINFLIQQEIDVLYDRRKQEKISEELARIILDVMAETSLHFSETSFQNLVLYIYVMYKRMIHGFFAHVEEEKLEQVRDTAEFQVAQDIVHSMKEAGWITEYSEHEVFYVSVYIACRRSGGSEDSIRSNFVVPEKVLQMADRMMDEIFHVYQIDFRSDLDFKMMIANHMVPFSIRMQYGIPLKNPLLEEIRTKYPFVHAMSQRGMAPLAAYYNREISDDEIGYFTMYFMMALGNKEKQIKKKNILLVCITGKAGSHFLKCRFENELKEYINEVQNCSIYELEHYDLTKVDMIFSTVPIHKKVNVPIYAISDFFEAGEILDARKKIELGNVNFIKDFYKPELFFKELEGNTKEEVIEELCRKTSGVVKLPETFCESVKEREKNGSTDYGNHVAIPHPQEELLHFNLVSVGILKKPILWNTNSVQMVIMMSVFDSTDRQAQKFYEVTTRLLSSQEKVDEIIAAKSYEVLLQYLG